jgi:hypothetical protein
MAFDQDATPIRMASPRISLYNLAPTSNHTSPSATRRPELRGSDRLPLKNELMALDRNLNVEPAAGRQAIFLG